MNELKQVLAPGKEAKIFLNPEEGLWYGNVHQNKMGMSMKTAQLTKTGQAYADPLNTMLSSPPKK
jgi:hypothetical protein